MNNFVKRLVFYFWYLKKPPWDSGVSPPELMDFIASTPPGRALDLGCGTGTNVITLAQNHWQVTGVDFVSNAINKAHHRAQQAGVQIEFILDDVTKLSALKSDFDLILDIGCFHNLTEDGKLKYMENLRCLLAPHGTFLLYAFIHSTDSDKSGLSENDLARLSDQLTLISRQDGFDHGKLSSSWLRFINDDLENL